MDLKITYPQLLSMIHAPNHTVVDCLKGENPSVITLQQLMPKGHHVLNSTCKAIQLGAPKHMLH